jgi:hypothetical protein
MRRHAPAVLKPVEEALDPVSGGIQGTVDRVLDVPVLFCGNLGRAASGTNVVPDSNPIISLICSAAQS